MSTVLVTGGAGFIGSHLCPLLAKNGHKVVILDNLSKQIHGEFPKIPDWVSHINATFITGSVEERAHLEQALEGVTTVIHLAAETGTGQSMYDIERYNAVNSQGTALLMDIIANQETRSVERVLLASSRSVYGEGSYKCTECPSDNIQCPPPRSSAMLKNGHWEPECEVCASPMTATPTSESASIRPASIYAATKHAQEELVAITCRAIGVGYAILRLQNVYGEGQSLNNPYTGILSIFSTRIRLGKNLPIFEDGYETRDFVHVSDVAEAFVAATQNSEPLNDVANVGTGEKTTVLDIAESLCKAFNKEVEIIVTGEFRVGDIRHNRADISVLENRLQYTPKVSLAEGLERFAAWVNTQAVPEDKLDKANDELKKLKLMG